MSLGHALKTANQNAESIEAYRRCIELAPHLGEVWWSLANLKTFRFTASEIATMRAQLERDDLTNDDRFHFHFALGKALEDAGEYAASFDHYAQGNALRRKLIRHDAEENAAHVQRSKRLFTREFFARTRRLGLRRARSDLHRRPAARPVPRWSSRSWRHTRRWKARRSCPTSRMIARAVASAHLAHRRRPPIRARSRSSRAEELRELGETLHGADAYPA